ncbi:hypothetical protein [Rothia sp. ZJ1223]|uniref:hypothetical protein n=1 Tax=Rothia sp. ZJ1223 TaxID=2811098 RepID=UPI00195DFBE0|nr:hypothetical protein [Rothia sp. ZJ1223]MBM7052020.1 hypothetical protein [Rothia sp. ZJ1223]
MNKISRRSLAKGAAWAAPVIISATAVPAYAASQLCTNASTTSITWTNFVRSTPASSQGSTSHSGSVVTNDGQAVLTINHVSSTGPSLSGAQNLMTKKSQSIPFPTYSGLSDYLFVQSLAKGSGGYTGGSQKSTMTMSFSTPVTGFSFVIGDIDQGGSWQDVYTVKSSLMGEATSAPMVTGDADISTNGDTTSFSAKKTNVDLKPTSTAGTVTLTFPEPIDTITLTWANGGNRTGGQNFVIGGKTTLSVCSTPTSTSATS